MTSDGGNEYSEITVFLISARVLLEGRGCRQITELLISLLGKPGECSYSLEVCIITNGEWGLLQYSQTAGLRRGFILFFKSSLLVC